jgi:predicted nucleic acid-binding Zn ribbon protein
MRAVAEMLPMVLRKLRHLPGLDTPVWKVLWQIKVGPALAAHTEVVRLEKGILYVAVDHHAWHRELRRMKPELVAALNEACGRSLLHDLEFLYRDSQDAASVERPSKIPRHS